MYVLYLFWVELSMLKGDYEIKGRAYVIWVQFKGEYTCSEWSIKDSMPGLDGVKGSAYLAQVELKG